MTQIVILGEPVDNARVIEESVVSGPTLWFIRTTVSEERKIGRLGRCAYVSTVETAE